MMGPKVAHPPFTFARSLHIRLDNEPLPPPRLSSHAAHGRHGGRDQAAQADLPSRTRRGPQPPTRHGAPLRLCRLWPERQPQRRGASRLVSHQRHGRPTRRGSPLVGQVEAHEAGCLSHPGWPRSLHGYERHPRRRRAGQHPLALRRSMGLGAHYPPGGSHGGVPL